MDLLGCMNSENFQVWGGKGKRPRGEERALNFFFFFLKKIVGTKNVMDSLVDRAASGATVVVCGTHTCQACKIWGTEEKFTHVSTGI